MVFPPLLPGKIPAGRGGLGGGGNQMTSAFNACSPVLSYQLIISMFIRRVGVACLLKASIYI